jgi:hypothetical protein
VPNVAYLAGASGSAGRFAVLFVQIFVQTALVALRLREHW